MLVYRNGKLNETVPKEHILDWLIIIVSWAGVGALIGYCI